MMLEKLCFSCYATPGKPAFKIGQIIVQDIEALTRIEPARIEAAGGELPDLIADIAAKAEGLGRALHPKAAANLAGIVRVMNTYYSNLIEGLHPIYAI
jgi:hypothetical protein